MKTWFVHLITIASICLCGCSDESEPAPHEATYSRIVSLAPNLTELIYAAGAGDAIVGVSAYSDYPPAALDLPIVGDAFVVDQERLAILQPDLLLVWKSGTPLHVVQELRRIGYSVEVVPTRSLADVASALRRIGELTGHTSEAERAATAYLEGLRAIELQYADRSDVRVFYQIDQRPLYTISGEHYVSELIGLCGGSNIFSDLNELAPAVDVEAVVDRDPEVILASSDANDHAFDEWDRWPHIAANRYGNRFVIPADEIGRATPRLLTAAGAVCNALVTARENRAARS